MATVLNWNGEQIPKELRDLPRGRYVLEPVDETPELSPEDEEAIEAAIESVRQGRGVTFEAFQQRIDGVLRR